MRDLCTEGVDDQLPQGIGDRGRAGSSGRRARVSHHLFRDRNQIGVLAPPRPLALALTVAHPRDGLHAAAGAPGAVGKVPDRLGDVRCQALPHQAREHADPVPQQRGVGGVVDVRFHHHGVDPQLAGVFEPELDKGRQDGLVQLAHGLRPQPRKAALESIGLGDLATAEAGELPQGIAVGDAFAQLAIGPILDAPQHERPQHLHGPQPAAPRARALEPAHQIAMDELDQGAVAIEKVTDLFEDRIELDALELELQVSKAPLHVGRPHPHHLHRRQLYKTTGH